MLAGAGRPFNVNYHYTSGEVAALSRSDGARAAIYERGLADLLRDVAPELDVLLEVEDDTSMPSLARATPSRTRCRPARRRRRRGPT